MSYEELCNSIKESIDRMRECKQKPSEVVIAKKYEDLCRKKHSEVVNTTVIKTVFGVPLGFEELPENLIFYITSEVTE